MLLDTNAIQVGRILLYLATFLEGRHMVGSFDGKTSIYLKNDDDMRLLNENFSDKIESIQRAY